MKDKINQYLSRIKPVHFLYLLVTVLLVSVSVYFLLRPKNSPTNSPTNLLPNTTIVKTNGTYPYQNLTNNFQTKFKNSPTSTESIIFSNSLGQISFHTPSKQSFGDISTQSSIVSDGSTLTYQNIFPQMDLRYTVSTTRLLEEFIIKDAPTAKLVTRIDQQVNTTHKYTQNTDGSITFTNDKNQNSFTLPRPIMYEVGDQSKVSNGLVYEIKNNGNQLIISKVVTSEGQAWLLDKKRVYPIAIDLVIDNGDDEDISVLTIDNGDNLNNWTSSDTTNTLITQEAVILQEGTGSIKADTTGGDLPTINVDLMEYSSNGTAQSAYVTSDTSSATGGTITTSGGYTIHTFNSNANFVPNASLNIDYFLIGGGGGGGGNSGANVMGGGGGGGGYQSSSTTIAAGTFPVVIGPGGSFNTNGTATTFNGITAGAGRAGNSNGTGGASGNPQSFAAGVLNGGAGGGGGASAAGANGTGTWPNGGAGGAGITTSISGSPATYGGGGGGGAFGAGGSGGGGAGGQGANSPGAHATANTGGGGGGQGPGVPTAPYGGTGGSGKAIIRYLTPPYLQSFSEASVVNQGTYSLRGTASQTTSLNKTLTRTIGAPINLSNRSILNFDIRATRTGSNIKIGLHDSGGTTTEVTPNITSANVFQTASIDLSGVANANKDAIDQIIITIVNADVANTFYIDNLTVPSTNYTINDTVTKTSSPFNLSTSASITYWVRSSVAGSYATFGFGESSATEQTQNITISQANTWEQKTWDISALSAGSRDAVTKFAFSFTSTTSGADFYFDDIKAVGYSNTWVSSDTTYTQVSAETTIKQEGAGSIKIQTADDSASATVIDLMEYSSDASVQSAYTSNAILTNATGGTITNSGGYTIHTFTSSGTFTKNADLSIEYLVVAGGGGGGTGQTGVGAGGGGGAGGFLSSSATTTAGDTAITVGAGGAANTSGNNSAIAGIATAIGGGRGGRGNNGAAGGSGGGGGGGVGFSAGAGTVGQGNNGGNGANAGGGGGGGRGSVGIVGQVSNGGAAGAGLASSISGASLFYSGGGGGGGNGTSTGGAGGSGVGGAGGGSSAAGSAGTANRGGGGGGGNQSGGNVYAGGAGGSGVVIIRYLTPPYLQSYSESTIKTQGAYSLRGTASATTSLNKTLTRTPVSPLDLSDSIGVTFDIRATRTGSNIKIGLHDSGGTTTEVTPNITSANVFQTASIDLSGVANANKDAIDQIIITIVNADVDNTFYVDNLAIRPLTTGDTVTATTAPLNLSSTAAISYWVRSSVAGSYATFGFGESSATEQTQNITISQANTWEQKTWDISALSAGSRDAVTKFAFSFTGNTTGASFYFDDIKTNALFVPTIGTPTALTNTSIRWTFTDNSNEEMGFKIYDTNNNLLVTCSSANLTYCDETGLSTNTQYTRKIGTYNSDASNINTNTVSIYTLAAVPAAPVISDRQSTTIKVDPSPSSNPANTLMAVYREVGTTCDGVGGAYILASSGASNGATADWQTDATWGNKTMTGLTAENTYSFCVKAKNTSNIETAFSPVGDYRDQSGYIPVSGDYVFTQPSPSTNYDSSNIVNRFLNGNNLNRHIFGVDNGASTNAPNTAAFEVKSGILTINAIDTLVVGRLLLTGGSVAIAQGGEIVSGPLWIVDADNDGFPGNNKLYFGTAPAGAKRKNLATTLSTLDCNDNVYDVSNSTLGNQYVDNDGDGYGVGNPTVMCAASGYAMVNGDCDDNVYNATNSTYRLYYADTDGDTYGNPAVSITACPTVGYVIDNTDCGPTNANAKPGSATCSTATFTNSAGAASRDWNCSGGGNAGQPCGTAYFPYGSHSYCDFACGQNNATCCATGTVNYIPTAASQVACGAAGYTKGAGPWGNSNCGGPCNPVPQGYNLAAAGNQACN